jgi:hypothetical protein
LLDRLELATPEAEDKNELLAAIKEEKKDDDESEEELAGTMVRIGQFLFKLERAEYLALIEDIRQNAGFAEAQVQQEIRRRLGIKDE